MKEIKKLEGIVNEETEWELPDSTELTPDVIKCMGEEGYKLVKKSEEMRRNPRKHTREERLNILKDLTFEQKALREGWSEEEKAVQREEYERLYVGMSEKAGKRVSPMLRFMEVWLG